MKNETIPKFKRGMKVKTNSPDITGKFLKLVKFARLKDNSRINKNHVYAIIELDNGFYDTENRIYTSIILAHISNVKQI